MIWTNKREGKIKSQNNFLEKREGLVGYENSPNGANASLSVLASVSALMVAECKARVGVGNCTGE